MALPLGDCHEIAPTMDDQRKRNTLKKLFHKESTKMDLHKDPAPNAPADGDSALMMGVELSTSTSLSNAASSASQLFHQSESSQAFQEACEIAEQLFGIVKDVSEATELLSPLKSASALMMRGIQAVRAVHNNSTSWVDLCNDLLPHVSQMEEWKGQLEKKGVIVSRGCLAVLNQYLNIAAEIIKTAAEYGAKRANFLGLLRRAGTVQTEKEEIVRLRQKATNMWQAFIAAMNMDVFHGVDQIQAQLAMPGALAATLTRSIGVSVSRTAYGTKLDICEEGTRAEVLMEIRTWATSVATDGQIFWLKGAGGTGKSTIAATMTREWSQQGTLAGRFFFSPNNVAERTTDNFCLTIAEDIAVNQPILNGTVRQAIISTPLDHFSFDQQFDRLVIRPLLAYPYMHSLYIVIDALDNCEDLDQRERLLETLMRFLPSAKQVKILLTSRPLQDITAMVNGCPLVDSGHAELLDSQDKAHKDIEIYVERKLGNHPMVSAEQRHMIVEQSGGLFLYAATICRLLKDLRRPTLLRAVTFSGSPQGLAQRMDELYLSILKQVCVDNTLDESFMEVLSMIIMAFQPLSINTISEYLPGNEYVAHTVQSLGAVLKTDGPDHSIKVLHPTFREFLLSDKERATGFLVNPVESHVKLAYGCIGVLEDLLCCNVIQIDPKLQSTPLNATIPDLGSRLAQYISPAAEYASVFWTHHVEASDPDDSRLLWSRVLRFLSEMLLNWVELMSWKGEVVRCIDGLSRLHTKAKQISSESLDILSHDDMLTIRQAHQFVVYHQDVISESALQVYSVALFFTPYDSPIFEHYRAHYHSRRPTIIAPYITDWGNHVTLGNHAGTVELVLLSPDGTRFISAGKCRSTGFGGSELFLWDIETGALIRRLSQGQRIGRCRFSPDGQYLAFQAEFQLHVHSSKTGEPTMSPIEFSLDEYHRVYHFFSQGRPYITWLSLSLARIVNFKTGRSVRLVYLARDVHCTSVSLDGRRLATMHIVPDSGTQITLWDWTTFTSITTIMDSQHLNDGLLSADGARLASWNLDSLRLWNVSTDKGFEKPVELEGGFVCVSFSLYGKYFARLSRADLKVWDCESGACVLTETVSADGTIESGGYNISFAGNEQKLALTTGKWSEEPIVRIWALPSGQPLDPMTPSHPTRGRSSLCQLSADWTKWILATRDNELNLYNLQEINKRAIKKEFHHTRFSFAITALGPILAATEESQRVISIRVWDVTNKREFQPGIRFNDDRVLVHSLTFSPDGRMIAVCSGRRRTVTIWDIYSWKQLAGPSKSDGAIYHYQFSPNSTFFSAVSKQVVGIHGQGSQYHLCVWNILTGERIWHHSHQTNEDAWANLNFSLDSTHIFAWFNQSLYIGDLSSNNQIRTGEGVTLYMGAHSEVRKTRGRKNQYLHSTLGTSKTLMAAVDGNVSSSWAHLDLWNVGTGLTLVDTFRFPWLGSAHQLTFSSDEKYLAYGPLCWEVGSGSIRPYIDSSQQPGFVESGPLSHSFLTCKDGWIHSTYPPGPLLPIPTKFRPAFSDINNWFTRGDYVILPRSRDGPILIDCSVPLAQLRRACDVPMSD